MTARFPVAAALGLALLGVVELQAQPAPAASVRDVVYFGPAGPVRIRLHVSIDGRPADVVWAEAVDALFVFCDRNADGGLDPAERAAFAPPTRRDRDLELLAQDGAVQPLRLTFPAKDEKVTKAAFAEAVRAAGRGSIGLRVAPARSDSRQLSAALFKHLDRSGDGRLSADELKAARDRLAALDVDEDEFVTAAELLGRAVTANPGRVRIALPGARPEEPAESSSELVFLTADGAQGVKQLLAARGGARATALRPAEFGADPKAFAALDKDANGRLDTTELAAWLGRPPEIELALAFGADGHQLKVVPPHPPGPGGAVVAALPGGRFRFEPPGDANSVRAAWDDAAGRLRDQFKELAKGSGTVERKQLERQPNALAFFDLADRNADGKVDAAEVEAALKAVAPLARCRAEVTFADQGDGLFELLDPDGDGRLSPRELVKAADALSAFAGPDGAVGPKDLVREFRVRAAVDPVPVGVLVPQGQATPAEGPARPTGAPAWFTRTDRNGDGDVSLREFLGPVELFRKLDRDGDGLISPAEAVVADK
jgi:Ca2+-binding EF-hand superfamily protein